MNNKKYMPKVGDKVIVISHPYSPTKENGYNTQVRARDIVTVHEITDDYRRLIIAEDTKYVWRPEWVKRIPETKLEKFLNTVSNEGELYEF